MNSVYKNLSSGEFRGEFGKKNKRRMLKVKSFEMLAPEPEGMSQVGNSEMLNSQSNTLHADVQASSLESEENASAQTSQPLKSTKKKKVSP